MYNYIYLYIKIYKGCMEGNVNKNMLQDVTIKFY